MNANKYHEKKTKFKILMSGKILFFNEKRVQESR